MFIDASFVILLLLACLKGMKKGFIKSLFSFFAFLMGMLVAVKFSALIAKHFSVQTHNDSKWIPFLAFIFVFTITAVAVHYAGKIFQKTTELVMLGWLNKMGGVFLFVFLYGMIFSLVLYYAVQLGIIKKETTDASYFFPYLAPLAPDIINSIGKIIPMFKNLFQQLDTYFNRVADISQVYFNDCSKLF